MRDEYEVSLSELSGRSTKTPQCFSSSKNEAYHRALVFVSFFVKNFWEAKFSTITREYKRNTRIKWPCLSFYTWHALDVLTLRWRSFWIIPTCPCWEKQMHCCETCAAAWQRMWRHCEPYIVASIERIFGRAEINRIVLVQTSVEVPQSLTEIGVMRAVMLLDGGRAGAIGWYRATLARHKADTRASKGNIWLPKKYVSRWETCCSQISHYETGCKGALSL